MNSVYLLLGSNLGNSAEILGQALEMIEHACGKISVKSSLYETDPWGFESENKFLNIAVHLETNLSAVSLLNATQIIEEKLGRVRTSSQYSSRLIDIDILFYNVDIIDSELLIIPHPRMHMRRFTLQPMSEIASDFIHPLLLKPICQLLNECTDTKNVRLSHDN